MRSLKFHFKTKAKWAASLPNQLEKHLVEVEVLKSFLETHGVPYAFTYGVFDDITKVYTQDQIDQTLSRPGISEIWDDLINANWIFNGDFPLETVRDFIELSNSLSFEGFCRDRKFKYYSLEQHPMKDAHAAWAKFIAAKIRLKTS